MHDATLNHDLGQAPIIIPPPKCPSKSARRVLRLADAESELNRVETDLYSAIVLADHRVREMLQDIRRRVVVALGAIRTQRGEHRR